MSNKFGTNFWKVVHMIWSILKIQMEETLLWELSLDQNVKWGSEPLQKNCQNATRNLRPNKSGGFLVTTWSLSLKVDFKWPSGHFFCDQIATKSRNSHKKWREIMAQRKRPVGHLKKRPSGRIFVTKICLGSKKWRVILEGKKLPSGHN